MNKKTRKLLTWCLVVAMVVTQMLFTNIAFASTRTSGNDRYMTAIAISQANFTKADTVVLATGDDFADALAAAPLAYAKKGPLLLTASGSLSDGVLAEIQRLGAKNVIIVGGTKAVSESVASALSGAGLTVSRLSGADRYATSVAIANAEGTLKGVVIANGNTFADALSISSIAAFEGMAIILTDGNSLSSDASALASGKTVYAVGGSSVLSDAIVAAAKATRLAGADRFATNVAVATQFAGDVSFANVFVATGEDFADALAGAVAAANSKSVIILVGSSLSADQLAFLKGKMTKDSKVNVLGGKNAVSDSVAAAVDAVTGTPAPAGGPVSVTAVKAVASDTMEVDFSAVPADTSKVVFTVQRESTPVTVTASWNGSVATLKYSAKFPQGNYTVNVKNDKTDLGTNNVTIDQQKVAKIDVTTDKFAVTSNGQTGYFTYKVYDQYGNDVTNTNIASVSWTIPGANYAEASNENKGVIKSTSNGNGFNFLNLSSITVTGVDSSSNIVVTKTLGVNASVGTLSNIKLDDVTNVNNLALQAGNSGEKWNITYEAADLAGNATTNYAMLEAGLVDQNNPAVPDEVKLSTSGYITAKMVNKSGVGVIELTTDPTADNLTTDVPVTVTAITKNGTTSTLNLTLKKKPMPSQFTIMAPATDISYGDSKEIPFVCSDSDGNALTNFADIVDGTSAKVADDNSTYYTATKNNSVSISPIWDGHNATSGMYFVQRGDNTAKLMYHAAPSNSATDLSATLTATTISGKFSTVTVNVRPTSDANTLTVADSNFVTRLTPGGIERIKHDWFTVKDNYGRTYDLTDYFQAPGPGSTNGVKNPLNYNTVNANATYIQVVMDASAQNLFTLYDGQGAAVNGNGVIDRTQHLYLAANEYNPNTQTVGAPTAMTQAQEQARTAADKAHDPSGTGTITFKLYDAGQFVASKQYDFTVEKLSDINSLKIGGTVATDTIYDIINSPDANAQMGQSRTFASIAGALNGNYKYTYLIYGVDGNGNNVVMPRYMDFNASASNSVTTINIADDYNGGKINPAGAADFNELQIASAYSDNGSATDWTSPITVTTVMTDENGLTSVKSASQTVKVSSVQAVAKTITGPDELKLADYSYQYTLADAISIKDQYGKNMLSSKDSTVKFYLNGVLQASPMNKMYLNSYTGDGANNARGLVAGDKISLVANNGQTFTCVVK